MQEFDHVVLSFRFFTMQFVERKRLSCHRLLVFVVILAFQTFVADSTADIKRSFL